MQIGDFEIQVVSMPDRDDLFAEIYYKNEHLAVVFEDDRKTVYFYNNLNKDFWEFSLIEILNVFENARQKLIHLEKRRD